MVPEEVSRMPSHEALFVHAPGYNPIGLAAEGMEVLMPPAGYLVGFRSEPHRGGFVHIQRFAAQPDGTGLMYEQDGDFWDISLQLELTAALTWHHASAVSPAGGLYGTVGTPDAQFNLDAGTLAVAMPEPSIPAAMRHQRLAAGTYKYALQACRMVEHPEEIADLLAVIAKVLALGGADNELFKEATMQCLLRQNQLYNSMRFTGLRRQPVSGAVVQF